MDKEFFQLIEKVDELIPRTTNKLDDEALICECFCVSARDIRETCDSVVDFDLLKNQLNMGGGCQACIKSKDTWLNKIF